METARCVYGESGFLVYLDKNVLLESLEINGWSGEAYRDSTVSLSGLNSLARELAS